MESKAVAALIFVLLIHRTNCSDWTDYLSRLDERLKNYDDIQPNELMRNNPILKNTDLLVNKGDLLEVKMSKLFSKKTKRHESYYSLPLCRPNNYTNSTPAAEFENSSYVFRMLERQVCNVVCRVTLDLGTAREVEKKINDKYNVNMILGGLPLVRQRSDGYQLIGYPIGHFPLHGRFRPIKYSINNHLIFTVKYRKHPETETMRIVEFLVQPKSIKHKYEGEWNENTHLSTCYSNVAAKHRRQYSRSMHPFIEEIIFTYDVRFEEVVDDLVGHHSSR